MIKAVVFDMDGLMLDTERVRARAWDIIGEEMRGEKLSWLLPKCLGLPPANESKVVWEAIGSDFDYFEFNRRVLKCTDEIIEREGVPLKKGIVELLEYLKEKGIKAAVASSSFSELATKHLTLGGLFPYFSGACFGDQVKNGKPDPEIYVTAAKQVGSEPYETIVLEDSFNGIRGAFSGGFLPIMVPDTVGPTEEITSKTLVVCESLLDVIDLLNNQEKLESLKKDFFLRREKITALK